MIGAASGVADFNSDLDLILYYDKPPPEAELAVCREELGATNYVELGRAMRESAEQFTMDGVDCQLAHPTGAGWEADMATVPEQLALDTPTPKAPGGLAHPIPGATKPWQARIS